MDRFERAGKAFETLCRTMAKLRGPGGCPWDAEQTPQSLKPYFIEETYEAIEAIDAADDTALCEELGDVLLQVVFQAELANERANFDASGVAGGINSKLIRRHPHVFGDAHATNGAEALRNWEAIKTAEKPERKSVLEGIPKAMPALLRASRTCEKAASIGFDWPDAAAVLDKIDEEWAELRAQLDRGDDATAERREELGDLLFSLVAWSRHLQLDAEDALSAAIQKFERRFHFVEERLSAKKIQGEPVSLDVLEGLWEEAKRFERR